MNAYELADFIDNNDCEYIEYSKVATMLRQQADRIAELEKVSSKPVAWVKPDDANDLLGNNYSECIVSNEKLKNDIPLYTHPVKKLSDEEIEQIAKNYLENMENDSWYGKAMGIPEDSVVGFARAIIKEITE